MAALFLSAWFAPGVARAEVTIDRKGPALNSATSRDWLRHPHSDRYYTESWTLVARSDDGHILYLSFLYSNIGLVSGSTAVHISFTRPGKQATHHTFEYTQGEYGEDAGIGRIGVGQSWMALKDGKAVVRVKEKKVKMGFELKAWNEGVKLHSGRFFVDDDKKKWVEIYFHVPRADISGEVEIDGRKTRFTGAAYIDHWVQNVLGTDLYRQLWTLRFFHRDHTVAFLVQKTRRKLGGRNVVHLLVGDRRRVLLLSESMSLKGDRKRTDPKGHEYDTRYRVKHEPGKEGVGLEGTVTGTRLHERDSILDKLNAAQRQIVRLFAGNPVAYRLEADVELNLTLRDAPPLKLTGPGIIESIVLSKEE